MKTLLFLVLGEILTIGNINAEVSIMVWEGEKIKHVNKVLSLEEFPCDPYPYMLFYYTQSGELRCGEPEPN
ncbi:MAG: hypothetical protein CMI54_07015 [Parcubacteria group bacterium]|nr:hypothetical protein [Parcubacteria group bacterium]